MVEFCENCNNVLLPKNGKLYCRTCDQWSEFDGRETSYKIITEIKHSDHEKSPEIVTKVDKKERITDTDRKAFEDFFRNGN